jgi:hypothetical protein
MNRMSPSLRSRCMRTLRRHAAGFVALHTQTHLSQGWVTLAETAPSFRCIAHTDTPSCRGGVTLASAAKGENAKIRASDLSKSLTPDK